MSKVALLALACAVLGAGCDTEERSEPAAAAARVAPAAERSAAVTPAGLDEHLRELQQIATEHGGNRAAGTPGDAASVAYVSARLREAGYTVRLQPVRFPFFQERSARLTAGGRRLRSEADFRLLTYSGSGRAEGRVRAAGLGCEVRAYAGLPQGAVALVRRGRCLFSVKARNAERAGAAALLLTDPEIVDEPFSATLSAPGIGIPVLVLGADAADRLRPGTRARLAVDTVSQRRSATNVLAETPGGGRVGRVLMAGGHLDSVPAGPGMNDNGSGVAALLELAEALARGNGGARVRFAFWAAEELGLYGSRHYVSRLSGAERRRITGYVNLDMVGSPNAVPEVYGTGPQITAALRRALGGRAGATGLGGGSDHAPFRRAGIPVGGLFTGASENGPGDRPRDPCYHRRCDTIDNVDRRVLLRMTRAAAQALDRLRAQAK